MKSEQNSETRKVSNKRDLTLILFLLPALAFVFASQAEIAYLRTFGVSSSVAELLVRIDPISYLRTLVPLAAISAVAIGMIDSSTVQGFHRHFRDENPRRIGKYLIILTMVCLFFAVRIPTKSFTVSFLLAIISALFFALILMELWLYRKSPFEQITNQDSRVEGVISFSALAFFALIVIAIVATFVGRSVASGTSTFATLMYDQKELVVIRRYGDTLVTLPTSESKIESGDPLVLSMSQIDGLVVESKKLTLD